LAITSNVKPDGKPVKDQLKKDARISAKNATPTRTPERVKSDDD